MKTIKDNIKNELVIKNSKFITLLLKIDSSNIKNILEEIKKEYPKATHYCYAYIYNEIKHSSDDNEPTGTAGLPMLNVLEHENLNKILCIVIRYFGGIKLGAGGLIRAYTKSVTEVLKEANFLDLEKGYKINNIDGVRVNFEDGWALVRASNTGPNVTARFEAKTEDRLKEIFDKIFD